MNPFRESAAPENEKANGPPEERINGGKLMRGNAHVCPEPNGDSVRPALKAGDAWQCGECDKMHWWHGRYWLGHPPR